MLELWFDFSCPYAYLASRRVPALARAAGIPLDYKPMLLGGVFRGIGAGDGPMATLGPAKAAHNARDMYRWAELFGVPFALPAAHPMRTVRALRTLLGLPHSRWPAAIDALYAAYWQRSEDITQDSVIAGALAGSGASEDDIRDALRRADSDDIKDELRRRTDEAIGLGIFGAPAFVMRRPGREHLLIWGQDRFGWLEAILGGWDPDAGAPPGGPRRFGDGVLPFVTPSTLDVYFDVASPFAYLGLTQLAGLAACTGAKPRLRPILLGAMFRDIGQVDVPMQAWPAAKQEWVFGELRRWKNWWDVPFAWPTKFPQRTIAAQRLCVIAERERSFADTLAFAVALGRAMWAESRDLEDEATLANVLAACALPAEWLARTKDPEIKAALADHTSAAEKAGVFGVPTYIVDDKVLVWGQDRQELVMRALAGWRPEHG